MYVIWGEGECVCICQQGTSTVLKYTLDYSDSHDKLSHLDLM